MTIEVIIDGVFRKFNAANITIAELEYLMLFHNMEVYDYFKGGEGIEQN